MDSPPAKVVYEDCQGSIYSTATRCLPCRIARRQKLAEQRQRTQDGLARKAARTFDAQAFKQEKQRRAQLRRQWRAQQKARQKARQKALEIPASDARD